MVLERLRAPLVLRERPQPEPLCGEVRIAIEACAVCRTGLHVVDGELADSELPIVPGHQIAGVLDAIGEGVTSFAIGVLRAHLGDAGDHVVDAALERDEAALREGRVGAAPPRGVFTACSIAAEMSSSFFVVVMSYSSLRYVPSPGIQQVRRSGSQVWPSSSQRR